MDREIVCMKEEKRDGFGALAAFLRVVESESQLSRIRTNRILTGSSHGAS